MNLDRYERLAAEAIRAAAEGAAAVTRFDDELVLRPSRAQIEEALREEDLTAERALFAATTTGRDLLKRQGWTDQEIAALAAKHGRPRAKAASPAPQPATVMPPAAAIAPPAAMSPSVTPPIAAPATRVAPSVLAGTPDSWRAEFAKSPELQREFRSVDLYVVYMQGIANGRIHHHGGQHRSRR